MMTRMMADTKVITTAVELACLSLVAAQQPALAVGCQQQERRSLR